MPKRIYTIMGATGQIGHVIVEQLLKQGHQIRALGRNPQKLGLLKSKGAEIFQIDQYDQEDILDKAFKGADALFCMIPPGNSGAAPYSTYQDNVGEAIKAAIEKNAISYLVNLSSLGANLSEGAGPIIGLHRQEKRLSSLQNVAIVHLRAAYFMQNLLWSIPTIQQTGELKTPFKPDLLIPMVSTDDIGVKAAAFLNKLDFKGHTICEFIGPRDKPLSLIETTKILGSAIGKPDLNYIQLSYEEAKKRMLVFGMPENVADLMIEMYRAFNEGKCLPQHPLTPDNHGKITLEEFAKTFAKAFNEYREMQKARV